MKNKLFNLRYKKFNDVILKDTHVYKYNENSNFIGYYLDWKYRVINRTYFGIKLKFKYEK